MVDADVKGKYTKKAQNIDLEKVLSIALETMEFLASTLKGERITIAEWIFIQGLIKDALDYETHLVHKGAVTRGVEGMLNT